MLTNIIYVIVTGLATGAIYSIIAAGLNVAFATTGVFSFSHGAFYMLGGMLGVVFLVTLGWPIPMALAATILATAVGGVLVERIAVQPVVRRRKSEGGALTPGIGWFLTTFATLLIIQAVVALALGPDVRNFPPIVHGGFKLGEVRVSAEQVLLIVVALAVSGLLFLVMKRTLLGRALEAVADDREAAELRAIPVALLSMVSFGIAAGLAGLVGFLAAPLTAASPAAGLTILFNAFVAAAIGGMPDLRGALVGGLILGILQQVVVQWIGAAYQNAVIFGVLLVVLCFRPSGIFGRQELRVV